MNEYKTEPKKKEYNVLHILNSDFGNPHTMGYRSYQIFSHAQIDMSIFARDNLSNLNQHNIKRPFPFYRLFSRFAKLLRLINKNWTYLQSVEAKLFDSFAKQEIQKHDIIHFFHHSSSLIEYAKNLGKTTVLEGFTHPLYLQHLFNKDNPDGLTYDYDVYTLDENSKRCYELSDYIISPSSWVTQTVEFAEIDKEKIVQIEYGVHAQNISKYEPGSPVKFVFAGGVKRTKGIVELLEVFKDLQKENIELHIYGRVYNDLKEEVEKSVQESHNIFLHGFSNAMIEEYKKYDVYIFPSYFEGSSKTVFEAMSCELPIITTPNAGSIVRDHKDGLIIPAGDNQALKEAILEILPHIQEYGYSAKEYVKGYSWGYYASRVLKFYETIAK